jgi:hypothetical protein
LFDFPDFAAFARPKGPQIQIRLCQTAIFVKRFKLICIVSCPDAKISLYENQNLCIQCRRPAPTRGTFRDRHGRWVQDTMDVSARAREAPTNEFEADGEIVWS